MADKLKCIILFSLKIAMVERTELQTNNIKSPLNTKSIARIAAIQTLYQLDNSSNVESVLTRMIDFYQDKEIKNDYELRIDSKIKPRPSYKYLKELVKSTHNNIEKIDVIINQHLTKEWELNTLPKLLLAILRVAICEIKYFPQTPRKVILNEYTDIASDMLDEGEIGFVNSVLDNYSLYSKL